MRANERPEVGQPIDLGASGVYKRLAAFERHWDLSGGALLDLGCGNGAYTVELAKRYNHVDAVDPTAEHLELFRRSMPEKSREKITLHEGVGESLPFPDDHFDAVTCIEVLEHVSDVGATVREVLRVLRPGGVFLVTVPNRGFPFETHMVHVAGKRFPGRRLPGLPWVPPLHRKWAQARIYTARTLRREVLSEGFIEIGIDFVMPPFDRWKNGRRYIKPVVDRLEQTRVRRLGVSVAGIFQKPRLSH
ncbi:class I SAM-dependent methyltransferase [Nocardioidaceae bacterium]|nr:class I SAM-dependent methyltransferase [Nocardioidaceae bacterium]